VPWSASSRAGSRRGRDPGSAIPAGRQRRHSSLPIWAISSLPNKKVLLIDLNLQFGDAVLFIHDNKPPPTSVTSRNIQRLDASFLAGSW
jgi:hypothetical protein